MCSRYRTVKEEMVITINGKGFEITLRARYNASPAQKLPTLLPNIFEPVEMKWGWQPVWRKTLLINAQAEAVVGNEGPELIRPIAIQKEML